MNISLSKARRRNTRKLNYKVHIMTCLNFSFDILSLISASKWSITLPLAGLPRFIPNLPPSRYVLIGYFNNQSKVVIVPGQIVRST